MEKAPIRSSGFRTILLKLAICVSIIARLGWAQDVSISAPQFDPSHIFQFKFNATAGISYPIEVSSDLVHWTLLTNLSATGSSLTVKDPDSVNWDRLYYHVGPRPTPIPNMVYIPPGAFTMGSPASEPNRSANEGPQTSVRISQGFWIGKYEVTQNEFIAATGANDSIFNNDLRLPVDFVSWNEATNFCAKLTQIETTAGHLPPGYIYRLPTEAEWEYVCRAGTTTAVSLGDGKSLSSAQANFDGTFPYNGGASGQYVNWTTLGGAYGANPWGLYDVHGNVGEWCQDLFGAYPGGAVVDPKGAATGSNRVIRGGAYNNIGSACRSAKRDSRSQTIRNFGQGIRVVLSRTP